MFFWTILGKGAYRWSFLSTTKNSLLRSRF